MKKIVILAMQIKVCTLFLLLAGCVILFGCARHPTTPPTGKLPVELGTDFTKGKELADQAKFSEAIPFMEKALSDHPDSKDALYYLFVSYSRIEKAISQESEAYRMAERLVKLYPDGDYGKSAKRYIDAVNVNTSLRPKLLSGEESQQKQMAQVQRRQEERGFKKYLAVNLPVAPRPPKNTMPAGPAAERAALHQTITNSKDGSELILIPAGKFLMGSPSGEGLSDEHPQHTVYLSAYYIGKYEVTNEQFAKFVSEARYQAQGKWKHYYTSGRNNHPVVCVTWNDAVAYCKWANLRLPTAAEWEKAARGTDGRKFPWGNNWDARRCNNSVGRSSRGTKPVGSYSNGTSPYGCLDMAGNAWEWCSDWYGKNYYSQSPQSNPKGPGSGSYRVLHGGSWYYVSTDYLRCAFRSYNDPGYSNNTFGFRVVRPR